MPGLGGDPRQMAMMMRKLGIDVREIDGVEQVVVRTATKDYVFDRASVSVMKAQGVETWQVSGKPRTVEKGAAPAAATAAATSAPAPAIQTPAAADTVLPISAEDVALVMKETGKSAAEAKAALEATKGDLAEAILRLS